MRLIECPRSGHGRSLLFLLLSVLLTLGLSACSNPQKAKTEHLRRGEQYLKERKYPEAALEFRNALQIDDRLVDAHWGLAQAYEGQENVLPEVRELQTTLQLKPEHADAATKLGNIYLLAYQANPVANKQLKDEAAKLAKDVLGRDSNNIEGHILLAGVLYAGGERDKALDELKTAVNLNPQRIESLMGLARFYVQIGDAANADATYQRALAVDDRSALAHKEYGVFLAQQRRNDQAEAQLRKAVEVEPDNREARRTLASFYVANKQFDKAEEVAKAWADLDRDHPEGRAVLADFYSTIGRDEDAIRVYQEIAAKWPDYTRAHYRLGEMMLVRGDLDGAAAQAKGVLTKNANDMEALKLRARVNLQMGEAKQAIDDLAQVLKQEPRDQTALYFMAQAQLALGQIEQARSYAADLDKYSPDYLPGKLLQAQISLRASGEDNLKNAQRLAADLIERLDKLTPGQQTSTELLAELRAKAYTARGAASLLLKDTKAARADFTVARDAAPNVPDSYVNLASVALTENKPAEAEQLFERALQIDNANFNAMDGLLKLYNRQGQFDRAHARVDQAIATRDNAGLHFLKAQVYGVQQDAAGAERELRRTLELDPNNAGALTSLAALYVNTGQPDRAVTEYRNVISRPPDTDDAAAYTLIGMVEDGRKNYDDAIKAYKEVLTRSPEATIGAIASNNLAWDYAENGKGNLDEAVRLAQGVVQKFPDQPGYADTLGWVYFKKGLYGAAVEQLQKAVNQSAAANAESALYRLHLGRALASMGRKAEARQQLQLALNLGTEKKLLSPEQLEEARQALATL
jgi:tetratricopeptide (TPR) repeat protein